MTEQEQIEAAIEAYYADDPAVTDHIKKDEILVELSQMEVVQCDLLEAVIYGSLDHFLDTRRKVMVEHKELVREKITQWVKDNNFEREISEAGL